MASFGSVRSLERGLKILEALNRCHGAKAQQIARMVDLPRPTTYRLLETLDALGYIARSKSDDGWHLTPQIKMLSAGFHDDVWIARVAAPVVHELGKEVLWPVDLVTYQNATMIIRETTHVESPFSIDRGMAGSHLPILGTSGGRAYLSFCPERERALILQRLRRSDEPYDALARDKTFVTRLVEETRRVGYGSRSEGFNPHTASISMPIRQGERVLACVSIIWIARALSFADAVARNLPPLRKAIGQIEAQLQGLDAAVV
ncbi:MAG TPA: DNA-binding transcriptional activator MhpR [Pseudolabrys sp.]|nr:DNA-binding transcriptional activator MhpR [Pseudolabrys sp.]